MVAFATYIYNTRLHLSWVYTLPSHRSIPLSTGAPLYALYRFKLISNKFRFSTLLLWVVEGGVAAGGNVDFTTPGW